MSRIDMGYVEIPVREGQCELWLVQGIERVMYPTKMAAEVAARFAFPAEHEERRYARIYYRHFFQGG